MDCTQTFKKYTKTMHRSCHKIVQYAKQKMDQKMLIQMYTHGHLTVYRIHQSAVKIHQASTKPRK